jgi:hypothetical protein
MQKSHLICSVEKYSHTHKKKKNSVEHSLSWEGNSRSACQEISHLLIKPEVHYGVHIENIGFFFQILLLLSVHLRNSVIQCVSERKV